MARGAGILLSLIHIWNIFPAALQYGGRGDRRAVCRKRGTILRQRFVRSDHQSVSYTHLDVYKRQVLSAIFGTNMKDGGIGKISENRFARADLEHILLCVDDDMRMEALRLSLIHI